jgi:hypothetical protein
MNHHSDEAFATWHARLMTIARDFFVELQRGPDSEPAEPASEPALPWLPSHAHHEEAAPQGLSPDPLLSTLLSDPLWRRDPVPALQPRPAPPPEQWCFAPSGNGYLVAGFGESGHLSGYKGLSNIAALIKTPGVAVPMLDLVGADRQLKADRRSRQSALDVQGLQQVAEQLQELRTDLERAQKDNNSVEADLARVEIERLEAFLRSAQGIRGKARDLNDVFNKLRPKIHGRLQTVYQAMQAANPPMNELAKHFELSISAEGGSGFIYRPAGDPPAWQFHRSSQK